MRNLSILQLFIASVGLLSLVHGVSNSFHDNATARKRREVIRVSDASQRREHALSDFDRIVSAKEETEGAVRFLQDQFSLTVPPSPPPTSAPSIATTFPSSSEPSTPPPTTSAAAPISITKSPAAYAPSTPFPSQMSPSTPEPQPLTQFPVKATPYPTLQGKTASPSTDMASPMSYGPSSPPTYTGYPPSEPTSYAPSFGSKTIYPTMSSLPNTPAPTPIIETVLPTTRPTYELPPRIPTGNPTADNILVCPFIPTGGCSVCGNGECVTEADALFSFPGQPTVRCDVLEEAGRNGLVSLDQCSVLPVLIVGTCGCQIGLSPAPLPTLVPTPDPTSSGICPSIPSDGCSVCGDGNCITEADAIFAFPGQPSVRCDKLEEAGRDGLVPLNQCSALPDLIVGVCGCQAGHSPTPAPTMVPTTAATQAPIFSGICPSIPADGCSVCGDGKCITQPDAIFSFPGQPSVKCDALQEAGTLGIVPLDQCELLSPLIADACGCGPELSPAPVPTPASCPSIPTDGCSVCGESRCITEPDAIFAFPGQPSVKCSDLQLAGENGAVPLDQCPFLPVLLVNVCGCSLPASARMNSAVVSPPTPSSPTLSSSTPLSIPELLHSIKSQSSEGNTDVLFGGIIESKAFDWLSTNTNLVSFSDKKRSQRFALACIYFGAYALPNRYTALHVGRNPKGWHRSDFWMTDTDECHWYGIVCDSNGDVEALNLKRNGLSGSFSAEASRLSDSLIRLDLTDNWIHNSGNELDFFLGKLSNLEYLFIGSTFFEHGRGVPSSVGLLSNLIAFDASKTKFTGKLNGDAFANKPILKSLDLSGNNFDLSGIPSELATAPKLQHLYMEASNLGGDLSFLEDMKEMVDLWIGGNQGIHGSIPASIAQTKALETLSITHCSLTGSIPSQLGSLEALKEVWLYDNQITGTIPDTMGKLSSLKTFELESNAITGTMPQSICNLISSQGSLMVLEADCIHEVVCDCCTACFGHSSSTKSHFIESTAPPPLPSEHVSQVPSTSLSSAAILIRSVAIHRGMEFLGSDSYQSRALAWIESHESLASFSEEKIIQRYTLACIYYSTYAVRTPYTEQTDILGWTNSAGWMDAELGECHWYGLDCDSNGSVDSIELPSNNLTGHLAPEVQLLKESLIRLDIFNNHIYNPGHQFNAFLGELTNMQYLYYGFTNFEYENGIPSEINKLTHLIEYDCAYTLYHGGIRGELFANLTKLKRLTMGGNAYNSSVPTEIAHLESLEYLYIDNADLTGDISFLGLLGNIKELWLDTNPNLMGSLPPSMGELTTLESFSMTNCGLTGIMPTELGSLARMQQLWLYGNELVGQIPTELGNLNRMRIIELEQNQLTGSMPTEICFNRPPIGSLRVLEVDCDSVTCPCCSACPV